MEPPQLSLKFSINGLPNRSLERHPSPELSSMPFPQSPWKMSPLHVLQQGPYGERSFISRDNALFVHLYPSESPLRSPPMKNTEYVWSPSMEPHVNRRHTYNGVQPGSPGGSFMTQQSLHQCHAAFSTIPSTLVSVAQRPISRRVL
jgi:hypothetical protein